MKHQDAKGRATHSQRLSGILDSALRLENNTSDLIDAAALLLTVRRRLRKTISRRMHQARDQLVRKGTTVWSQEQGITSS